MKYAALPRCFLLTTGLVFTLSLGGCGRSDHKDKPATPPPTANNPAPINDGKSGTPSTGVTPGSTDPKTGTTPSTKPADEPAANPAVTPVFVFMGGYTSCGNQGDPAGGVTVPLFDSVKQAFEAAYNVSPVYLLSCYTVDYQSVAFTLSSDQGNIYNKSVDSMIQMLNDELAKLTSPVVYIVGHSYGGWTAMDTALKLDPRFRLGGLVTLDPISKVDCTPDRFLGAAFGFGGGAPGCQRAPTDFGTANLAALSQRAGASWLNFYQTQVALLHSGTIAAAKNTQRQYSGGGLNPHNGFLDDDVVTQAVETLIVDGFAAARGG